MNRDNLLKKIEFHKTIEILSISGRAMSLRTFYERLLKNGFNYNAFYRIRDAMITTGIIEIYYEKTNHTKRIRLTKKGITVKQTINALLELME